MDSSAAKSGSSIAKTLAIIVVIALIALVFTIDAKRRDAENQLKQMSMKMDQLTNKNPQEDAAAAKAIVDDVKKIFLIPDGIEPTVATIVKIEELRKVNAFYNKAKNGDNLLVTNDRAILYDPKAKKILDVVPVQIQPAETSSTSSQDKQPAAAQPKAPAAAPASAQASSAAQ